MKYRFQPPSLESHYLDERWIKKRFRNSDLAEAMMALWEYLDNASSAYDIKTNPAYYFHLLKQDRKGVYSLAPMGKGKAFRLLVVCLDQEGKECVPQGDEKGFLQGVKELEIKELTDHYDEH
jgi:plasmid maintenance system killer protein